MDARRDGAITLPDGDRLDVTNLATSVLAGQRLTKGDLLRYYAGVSLVILPVVRDRPLVMKRFPNGVDKPARSTSSAQPRSAAAGVRIEVLPLDVDPIDERPRRSSAGRSRRCST